MNVILQLRNYLILGFSLLILNVVAAPAVSVEGAINFSKEFQSQENAFKKSLSTKLTASLDWYTGRHFERDALFAAIRINNSFDKAYLFQYFVAFFDEKGGLIGTAGQESEVEPDNEVFLASCIIRLPKAEIEKIRSYKIIVYETQKPD